MRILGRKLGEQIVLPQCRLTITVGVTRGIILRLAISGPAEIAMYQEEV
jgi:sRNA-binding carbon storage regulator CsrA